MWSIYVPLFRDPHRTCARCRGTKCSVDVTCDICKDWSVTQWEAFLKKLPYSGRRKKRPSGSALPTAPPTPPPKLDALRLPLVHPLFFQRGVTVRGSRRVSPVWVLVRSPLPARAVRWERRGEALLGLRLMGAQVIQLLPPSRGLE